MVILTNYGGLQINEHGTRHVFTSSSFSKESGKGIVSTHELIGRHLTIRLDAMFQAVQFPAGISNLATSLANVNGNTLTLKER